MQVDEIPHCKIKQIYGKKISVILLLNFILFLPQSATYIVIYHEFKLSHKFL